MEHRTSAFWRNKCYKCINSVRWNYSLSLLVIHLSLLIKDWLWLIKVIIFQYNFAKDSLSNLQCNSLPEARPVGDRFTSQKKDSCNPTNTRVKRAMLSILTNWVLLQTYISFENNLKTYEWYNISLNLAFQLFINDLLYFKFHATNFT